MKEYFDFLQSVSSDIKKHKIRKHCGICNTASLVYYTRKHEREVIAIRCENCGVTMMGLGFGGTVEEFCKNAMKEMAN